MVGLQKWTSLRFSGICSLVSGFLLTILGAVDVIETTLGGERVGLLPWVTLVGGILIAGAGVTTTLLVSRQRSLNRTSDKRRE